jgi:hypothetical protein
MARRSKKFYEEARAYNSKSAIRLPVLTDHPPDSDEFADVVWTFQKEAKLEADGKLGPTTLTHLRQELLDGGEPRELSRADLVRMVGFTKPFEGQYWSCNLDGEFKGKFGKDHWAYQKAHVGLSFGFIQFTQDGGMLGKLLKKMYAVDAAKFIEIFGPDYQELLTVTNKSGNKRVNGRKARVQPVAGADLWTKPWIRRFQAAGKHPAFQKCQLDLAVDVYMAGALKTCRQYNIRSERGIVIVFDRSVQYGAGGARSKLIAPNRGDDGEHFFLRRLKDKYADRRWGHRVRKLWNNHKLGDGPCKL